MRKPRVLIVSDERTGTNLITRLLDQHPYLQIWTEPFRHPQMFGIPKNAPIKKVIRTIFENSNGCAIHRTSHQPPNLPEHWESAWELLPTIPDLKVIDVRRANLLKRYVSLQVAIRLKKWIDIKEVPEELPRIRIQPELALSDFEKMDAQYRGKALYFSNNDVYHVNYETFVQNIPEQAKAIQRFIGVVPMTLRPATKKRETRTLPEIIENYDELRQYMFGTKWYTFFDQ